MLKQLNIKAIKPNTNINYMQAPASNYTYCAGYKAYATSGMYDQYYLVNRQGKIVFNFFVTSDQVIAQYYWQGKYWQVTNSLNQLYTSAIEQWVLTKPSPNSNKAYYIEQMLSIMGLPLPTNKGKLPSDCGFKLHSYSGLYLPLAYYRLHYGRPKKCGLYPPKTLDYGCGTVYKLNKASIAKLTFEPY